MSTPANRPVIVSVSRAHRLICLQHITHELGPAELLKVEGPQVAQFIAVLVLASIDEHLVLVAARRVTVSGARQRDLVPLRGLDACIETAPLHLVNFEHEHVVAALATNKSSKEQYKTMFFEHNGRVTVSWLNFRSV